MFERFTGRARQMVVLAQKEAIALRHGHIGTEHLLLGLLLEGEGIAARALAALGVEVEEARARLLELVPEGDEPPATGQMPFTPRAKKVLELALREALSLGHNYIGTEHVLLALVREGEGVAARVLRDLGADAERVRAEVVGQLGGMPAPPFFRGPRAPAHEVRTLEGRTDAWAAQLDAWAKEGLRLVAIVEEDGARRAVLARRLRR